MQGRDWWLQEVGAGVEKMGELFFNNLNIWVKVKGKQKGEVFMGVAQRGLVWKRAELLCKVQEAWSPAAVL